jgi:pyruvate/2-oxoglutarate/acetoin dehydrogenase E1 component
MPYGGGVRAPELHDDSPETYYVHTPGVKVAIPSTPADAKGLLAAAIRDPDPVVVFEPKLHYRTAKAEVPDGEHVVPLGRAAVVREGADCTIVALAAMVPRAVEAADQLSAAHGISAEVIDLRTLVPLDVAAILASVEKTSRLFTVEENPRLCGWGAEIVSIVGDEGFYSLDAPLVRITTPHVPLPSAASLEDAAIPTVERIVDTVRRRLEAAK